MNQLDSQYEAVTKHCGVIDLGGRTFLELTGQDRLKFLNNFCTADLKRLSPGQGTEAFLLNVKGKVLGHVLVSLGEASILLDTVPGQSAKLLPHLDRYTLMDDVQLVDRSNDLGELLIAGPAAASVLASVFSCDVPAELGQHVQVRVGDAPGQLCRTEMAGANAFLLRTSAASLSAALDALVASGAERCDAAIAEVLRLEAGFPQYGRDITEETLPQEANRDRQAISLAKGCYLGQETVARIDALGHVNRLLCGVLFPGTDVPPAGLELKSGDKTIGQVTSAVFSPRASAPLALAYVKTALARPGQKLDSALGEATVVALPLGES